MWTIRHAIYQTFVTRRKVNSFKLQATVSPNRIHPSLYISDIITYLQRIYFYHYLYHSLSLSISISVLLCHSFLSLFFSVSLITHKLFCMSIFLLFPSLSCLNSLQPFSLSYSMCPSSWSTLFLHHSICYSSVHLRKSV